MNYNPKFALIDKAGDARYAAIIEGTYQIGKDRRRKPSTIEDFARAILVNGEDGRFVCADGRKPAVLKYISTRKLEAVAYRLDPAIAARLGIAAYGTR